MSVAIWAGDPRPERLVATTAWGPGAPPAPPGPPADPGGGGRTGGPPGWSAPGDPGQLHRARVPFARPLVVEFRKLLDTAPARGLLATTLGAAVVSMWLFWVITPDEQFSYAIFTTAALLPPVVLLPVLGILSATSEWSKRTAAVTFALEPRRVRVVLAKVVAMVGLAALVAALLAALAALVTFFAVTFAPTLPGPDVWALTPSIAGVVATTLLGAAQGVAFGTLLMSTPVAVVLFFLLPHAVAALGMWPRLATVLPWVDIVAASGHLARGEPGAGSWAPVVTSYLLWGLVPLIVGAWLVTRREVT